MKPRRQQSRLLHRRRETVIITHTVSEGYDSAGDPANTTETHIRIMAFISGKEEILPTESAKETARTTMMGFLPQDQVREMENDGDSLEIKDIIERQADGRTFEVDDVNKRDSDAWRFELNEVDLDD